MSRHINHIYEFGDFRMETAEQLLLRRGAPVPLTRKAFDTLLVLVQSSGHLVEKDELMKRVWADAFVEETNLARNVWALRKALGDDNREHQFIETVPKLGYRFLAPVKEIQDGDTGILVQRRVRARIVREELETEEQPNAGTMMTAVAHASTLQLARPDTRRRRNIVLSILAIAGVLALIAVVGVIVRNSRSIPSAGPIQSVAVLPFANPNNEAEIEYLSDGVTENLINRLSHASRLKIIAYNSVRRFKGKEIDAQKVAGQLGVQSVLIGRVEVHGEELSVNCELVNAKDGGHLWGEHYQRKMSDLHSLQGELAQDIASALQLQFSGEEKKRLASQSSKTPEAYQLYLKGRYFWNKRTPDSLRKGLDCFEQAIKLDPEYAAAYVGVADCYSVLSQTVDSSPNDVMPKAKAAALNALRLDDTLAEAHASLAILDELYDWNWKAAEIEFKRAIELNPNYATAHHWYAMYLSSLGRHTEALAEINRAEALDPVSMITNTNEGWILFCAREYDQAIEKLRATIEMDPNFANAHYKLALVYEMKGMYKEAVEEHVKSKTLSGEDAEKTKRLTAAFAASGWKGYNEEELRQLNETSTHGYVLPKYFVLTELQLGHTEAVFRRLEEAYKDRTEPLVYLRVDPRLDGLRSDARFEDLLRRVNLAPQTNQ